MDYTKNYSRDLAPLLSPTETRHYYHPTRSKFLNASIQKYLLLVMISACMVFYLSYTGSLTWSQMSLREQQTLLYTTPRTSVERNNNEVGSWEGVELDNMGAVSRSTVKVTMSTDAPNKEPVTGEGWKEEKMACQLPDLNPFDFSIQRFITDPGPAECEKGYPLLFKTDLESNLIQVKSPKSYGFLKCCYQPFERRTERSIKTVGSCKEITQKETRIPKNVEYIRVQCSRKSAKGKLQILIMDEFGFVHIKPEVERRVEEQGENAIGTEATSTDAEYLEDEEQKVEVREEEDIRKVNVVVLGIDAVSRMNLMRIMPNTFSYITKNLSAVGLAGYTKVGDNTFPNIVPVLTGQSIEEIKGECWKNDKAYFDSCPFLWKQFSEKGYRTAYGEDAVWMGIFNYQKKGFNDTPTDYYWNPLTYDAEENIGHKKLINCDMCYGPRLGFEYSLDYVKKMAFTMDKTRRYFQFFWSSGLFHDYLNQGKLGDGFLQETMQWFHDGGYLEDTVFVLMSDHGIRWGEIRSTLQGRLEERMPFLYFIFPEWFKEKYRPAVSNMIRNEHRLTTPFDLHATLEDLLDLSRLSSSRIRERYTDLVDGSVEKLPRGMSLFLPVPARRTCEDAEIEDHWCVCRSMSSMDVSNSSLVEEAARNIMHFINGKFLKFPQCMTLSLATIFNAQVFQSSNSEVEDQSSRIKDADDPRLSSQPITISLALAVHPNNGTFEATVVRHTNGTWTVQGDISRTNIYGDQSRCVTDYNLKKFCYCR